MSLFKPYEWGQTRIIKPREWEQNKPLTIVTKDADEPGSHTTIENVKNPFTKNLTLGADVPPTNTGEFALRWRVSYGVGGGAEDFEIDANSLQQLTLSADRIRVSLLVVYEGIVNTRGEPLGTPFGFSLPDVEINASAFYAEGTTATDPPTLTQRFSIDTNATVVVPVPKFVSAFRILGEPPDKSAFSPFTSVRDFSLLALSGTYNIDAYTGDEIFGVRLAPIPTGEASALVLQNEDGVNIMEGSIAWELDL